MAAVFEMMYELDEIVERICDFDQVQHSLLIFHAFLQKIYNQNPVVQML